MNPEHEFHGPNLAYMQALRERYQTHPESLDAATREFFERMELEEAGPGSQPVADLKTVMAPTSIYKLYVYIRTKNTSNEYHRRKMMTATSMFCYQCEQTANGKGCTRMGVCGKTADVAALQDLLIYAVRGLSEVAVEARKAGVSDGAVNKFTIEALFSTLTNVDFDPARFPELINRCVELREQLRNKAKVGQLGGAAAFQPAKELNGLVDQGTKVGLMSDTFSADENIRSLQHTTLYGLKGVAAYADRFISVNV
jgi:hypothetical protein